MEFILGAASMLLFFVAYELGKRQGKQPIKEAEKPTEDELRKARKIREDFQRLMNYDVDQAIGKQVE